MCTAGAARGAVPFPQQLAAMQKAARCLYEVLGLKVYSDNEEDLKRAYRKVVETKTTD